uniref:Uncharacterized protein n=1 Tax=Tanacetum cinerariifolium TaxID=118510 RepID=A0A6L2L4Z1_TANCI|nr:hypothetical protein [Tanacetum cinerariifolium]
MRPGTSARFHFSIMEVFINCLRKIGNPTCEDLMLIELYEVVCKAEDDHRANPLDKTNKLKSNEEENDEKITIRTEGFFVKPVTKKRMMFPKSYYCQNPGHKEFF